MKTHNTLFMIAVLAMLASGCRSPYYADQGAAIGGVTGGLAGASIGAHHDNPLAGAAIGTAVGAFTGATVGAAIDEDVARSQAEIERRIGHRLQGAVTLSDVISMTQAGLSESVITTHIRANGVAQRPTAADLVTLSNAGVGEQTILSLQKAEVPGLDLSPMPVAPIIVEEHYYGPEPHFPSYHHSRGHHGRRHSPRGVHWGITIGR